MQRGALRPAKSAPKRGDEGCWRRESKDHPAGAGGAAGAGAAPDASPDGGAGSPQCAQPAAGRAPAARVWVV